jgi:hypothetical protein
MNYERRLKTLPLDGGGLGGGEIGELGIQPA